MNATAIIVTRGDQDLKDVIRPIPEDWQVLIWDNGAGALLERDSTRNYFEVKVEGLPDRAVYGRYAALDYALHDVVYVQDDDCVVSDPMMIALVSNKLRYADHSLIDVAVCNMPQEFRHEFYEEHALSGFGCSFPRTLPGQTFSWFWERMTDFPKDSFDRTCDIIFTGLSQRLLVEQSVHSLPYAHALNRMWKQTDHVSERTHVLEIVKVLAGVKRKERA